jgi:hypothetical protein
MNKYYCRRTIHKGHIKEEFNFETNDEAELAIKLIKPLIDTGKYYRDEINPVDVIYEIDCINSHPTIEKIADLKRFVDDELNLITNK